MAVRRPASTVSILRRTSELLVLVVAPAYMNIVMLVLEPRVRGGGAYDFRMAFLPAARAVVHGRSPFGPATVAALRPGTAFVYPPITAYVFAPFTWVPTVVAVYAVSLLMLACVPATLYLLGVRDWRCYGASLLWAPVWESVRLGALSIPLALLVALAWRYRHRAMPVAAALGGAVALKLFLWPLAVWLAATRRWKSLVAAGLVAGALVVVPWAVLGFAGLTGYPHLLSVLSSIEAPESYTVAVIVKKAGLGWRPGEIAGYAAGLLLLAAAARAGARRQDRTSFILAIAAALVLSPIVWIHYFALLLVPVAIMSPSFGIAWILPVVLFAFPITPGAASWQAIATALAIASATLVTSAGYSLPGRILRPAPTS
jgi:hypothetical protein